MLTTLELLNDDNWFPNSGATNHVTNELSNLNFGFEYNGRNKIHMGNSVGLMIAHSGFSSLCFSKHSIFDDCSLGLMIAHLCDNLSTLSLSASPIQHSWMKHIEFDLYFVCDKVLEKTLAVNMFWPMLK